MNCNVCGNPLGRPIYDVDTQVVLTSLCEIRPGRKTVWSCVHCGHLRGEALVDTQEYYSTEYRILLTDEEEDQIYEVHGDTVTYRTAHQASTLASKLQLPQGALLLDYGCAKASTPKALLQTRPDLRLHVFDVSEMYVDYWNRFIPAERQAVNRTPDSWREHFDVVTSFFALEHIPDPLQTVRHIASLLTEQGQFYGIVPDTFGNVADFVVIDHVNHFTHASLHALLLRAGFVDIRIDASAHRGALVFMASKSGAASASPDIAACIAASQRLAAYWEGMGGRIRAAEQCHSAGRAAIYGSGFYGAYIASLLQEPASLECFLDRSPFQQGKQLFGKPILAPEQLPQEVSTLYVGLNPAIARATIAALPWLESRKLSLVFLDEGL